MVGYAEKPETLSGVYLMDAPGHDGEVVTGFVGGGAHAVVFTTGRGTPTGFPFVPVIKVTGNNYTYERMQENIDFNAGPVISEERSIGEMGQELLDLLEKVCAGKQTKAEVLGHDELFCITRV